MAILCDHSGAVIAFDEYGGPTWFEWNGAEYQMDLCADSAEALATAQEAHAAAVRAMDEWAAKARTDVSVPFDHGSLPEPEVPAAPAKPKRARKAASKSAKAVAKKATRGTGTVGLRFDPPAEDLVLPDEPEAASNGNGKHDPVLVRRWAAEQGTPLSARGRIPAKVLADYAAAN